MSDWNVTVKCIQEFNPGKGTTLGQIYEVKKGRITYDNGKQSMNEFSSIEELNHDNKSQFEELKRRGRPKKQ